MFWEQKGHMKVEDSFYEPLDSIVKEKMFSLYHFNQLQS